MTGIFVFSMIYRTNALEPRGISRSTQSSHSRRASISLWAEACSRLPSGIPAETAASRISSNRTLFVDAVSFPPFRTAQLPLLMHRQLICTSASGLASKMIPITPIGTLTRSSTSPSSSSRFRVILPHGSCRDTRLSIPARQSPSLCSSNFSRFFTESAMPFASARSRSSRFAAKISSLCEDKEAATALSALSLTSTGIEATTGETSFIFLTLSRILIDLTSLGERCLLR